MNIFISFIFHFEPVFIARPDDSENYYCTALQHKLQHSENGGNLFQKQLGEMRESVSKTLFGMLKKADCCSCECSLNVN